MSLAIVSASIAAAVRAWHGIKTAVEQSGFISNDAAHILAGLLLQLAIAALLRTSVASWKPWLVLLGLLVANELVDLWVERWPDPLHQYAESGKDVVLTMLIPPLLSLIVRRWPDLYRNPV